MIFCNFAGISDSIHMFFKIQPFLSMLPTLYTESYKIYACRLFFHLLKSDLLSKREPVPSDAVSKSIILLKYLFLREKKKEEKRKLVSLQFLEGEILHCSFTFGMGWFICWHKLKA